MEIKGNIGEYAYIRALIRSVKITESGVRYNVLTKQNGYIEVDEEDILFVGETAKDELKPEKNEEPKEEQKEEPKKEPKKEPKDKNTLKTKEGRFLHSKWLRETIEASGMTQKKFCDELNAWLAIQHNDGQYTDIKRYYTTDMSGYMNGRTYMSEYKIHVIKKFAWTIEKAPETAVKEPKMETPEKIRKATVESTMAKLRKMRGEK